MRLALRRLVVMLVCTAPLPVALPAQTPAPRPLEVDDLFRIGGVGDAQVSPGGKWIAYTVTTASLADEKSETRIWMAPSAGGEAIPMTGAGSSASRPRWSPDGKYLSFLASRGEGKNAKTQVWVLNRLGGEANQLTDVTQGVSTYEWSPDGTRLLLAIRDPEAKPEDDGKGASKPRAPWVIDRLQFKRDGAGYLTGDRHTHLYVFDVRAKALTQITSGGYDESQPAWSPDGRRVAFTSNRTTNPDGNDNTDIWVVAADNTDKGQTLLRLTTNPGSDRSPAWSPDGKSIAYVTDTRPDLMWYATTTLAVVDAAGGEPRLLTAGLDRNVGSPAFAADGQSVYFEVEERGADHVGRVEIASRKLTRPVDGPVSVSSFVLGPGGMLVAQMARIDRPPEVYVVDRDAPRQLTTVNDSLFATLRLADVRTIRYPSRDGTAIEGFAYFPVGYDEGMRYPTLLRIHGGPVAQYNHRFNFEAQLFAANGYVVLTVNPRGSSGYGQDFSRAIWADWGNKDYDDVMAAVDYAVQLGWADSARLGVGGWSYGGILTDHIITRTDRFKAAITGASEVLYVANYGHDQYQLQWEQELGLPWEHREAWERISPFNQVEKIVTPTLIMGGESDWNVPIQNSEQLYQALKRLGRVTELVVYPGQPHGLRVPSYQKDRLERYLEWYGRYVKGTPDGVRSAEERK
jgi:dipeptidyl aminopeptidase/acylaminoacyl peptidase